MFREPRALISSRGGGRRGGVHENECPGIPFESPSLAELAKLLTQAGYLTPRGKNQWWPTQTLDGRIEGYYKQGSSQPELEANPF